MNWLIIGLKAVAVIGYAFFMANLLKTNFSKLIQSKNDSTVPSISRFQMLFWTGLYGFVFLYHFIDTGNILVFSQNELLLMGISGGVYLGGKWVGNLTGGSQDDTNQVEELKKEISRLTEEVNKAKSERDKANNS